MLCVECEEDATIIKDDEYQSEPDVSWSYGDNPNPTSFAEFNDMIDSMWEDTLLLKEGV